ncbi:MAG: hypothetical protein ACRER5_02930 [Pseudomonas sp.]
MKSTTTMLLAAALLPALTGCVVSQTRSGEYQFGFIDPGTTVAQFDSANGAVRLRRHLDGTYGLRFSDKLTVYKMGAYDNIRLMQTHTVGGQTAALFERRRRDCVDYELLTITNGNVDKYSIRPGCDSGVEVGVAGERMIIREDTDGLARFWIWGTGGVERGRERPTARTRSNNYGPLNPAPRAPAPRAPAPRASARVTSPTTGMPAPRRAPARASTRAIIMPTGSVETDVIQPTRVVLVRDGA